MKNKILYTLITTSFFVSLSTIVFGATTVVESTSESAVVTTETAYSADRVENDIIEVYINDVLVVLPVNPIVINDTTLVPMRAIFEALGCEVLWNEETATATGTKGGTLIEFTLNSTTCKVNGIEQELTTEPIIAEGYMMVPLRTLSETFGYKVTWLPEENRIDIVDNNAWLTEDYNIEYTTTRADGSVESHTLEEWNYNFYYASLFGTNMQNLLTKTYGDFYEDWYEIHAGGLNKYDYWITTEDWNTQVTITDETYIETTMSLSDWDAYFKEMTLNKDDISELLIQYEEFYADWLSYVCEPIKPIYLDENIDYVALWTTTDWAKNITFTDNEDFTQTMSLAEWDYYFYLVSLFGEEAQNQMAVYFGDFYEIWFNLFSDTLNKSDVWTPTTPESPVTIENKFGKSYTATLAEWGELFSKMVSEDGSVEFTLLVLFGEFYADWFLLNV